jgi:dihydrofolate reductase
MQPRSANGAGRRAQAIEHRGCLRRRKWLLAESAGSPCMWLGRAGGATTINRYLAVGLIDELRLHIAPLMLGAGTRLFEDVPPLNSSR